MSKLELNGLDVIHAFPTSGKTGLVLSTFEAGEDVPYLIDTDHILFGLVITNKVYNESVKLGKEPWRQSGAGRIPIYKSCESMAMLIASMVAKETNAIIITNLVSTLPYLNGFKGRVTLAPSESDMLVRHAKRDKAGTPGESTSDKVLREWHRGYMKHVSKWPNSVILEEGEYLCDYFGVKYVEQSAEKVVAYNKWLDARVASIFNTWKWKEYTSEPSAQSGSETPEPSEDVHDKEVPND
jgi:hypothetical protein